MIDKPVGLTSFDVIRRLKKCFRPKKIGHAGTLDPLASGCLPVAFGQTTKLIRYAQDHAKTYRFTLRWGESRESDDAQGKITARCQYRPRRDEIVGVLARFTGNIMQRPPDYSAIKINGERAYRRAREGREVRLSPRPVSVERLELCQLLDEDHAAFELTCGKGFYVRALARDLGQALGTLAYVTALRRERVGPFGKKTMQRLEPLEAPLNGEKIAEPSRVEALFATLSLPGDFILDHWSRFAVDLGQAKRVRNGAAVPIEQTTGSFFCESVAVQHHPSFITYEGKLVAIGTVSGMTFTPDRVFNVEGL